MPTPLPRTTDGPTFSDPDHLAQLIERHEVSVVVGAGEISPADRADLADACERRAFAWAEAEGIEIEVNAFDTTVAPDPYVPERCVGVWWDVAVGKAVVPPGPFVGLEWKWSARMLHWAGWFASMAAKAKADERAETVAAYQDRHGAGAIPLAAYRDTPPWEREHTHNSEDPQ